MGSLMVQKANSINKGQIQVVRDRISYKNHLQRVRTLMMQVKQLEMKPIVLIKGNKNLSLYLKF